MGFSKITEVAQILGPLISIVTVVFTKSSSHPGTRVIKSAGLFTLRAPSNRREAVMDEMICAINRFRFVYVGFDSSRFSLQMS
jgi:hypothetical protein